MQVLIRRPEIRADQGFHSICGVRCVCRGESCGNVSVRPDKKDFAAIGLKLAWQVRVADCRPSRGFRNLRVPREPVPPAPRRDVPRPDGRNFPSPPPPCLWRAEARPHHVIQFVHTAAFCRHGRLRHHAADQGAFWRFVVRHQNPSLNRGSGLNFMPGNSPAISERGPRSGKTRSGRRCGTSCAAPSPTRSGLPSGSATKHGRGARFRMYPSVTGRIVRLLQRRPSTQNCWRRADRCSGPVPRMVASDGRRHPVGKRGRPASDRQSAPGTCIRPS